MSHDLLVQVAYYPRNSIWAYLLSPCMEIGPEKEIPAKGIQYAESAVTGHVQVIKVKGQFSYVTCSRLTQ